MKLLLALCVCYCLVSYCTQSAFVKKSDASAFLAIVGKKHGGGRLCSVGRCAHEDNSDATEEQNIRVRSGRKVDSSSSESAMVPQDILLPPTPSGGITK